MAIDAQKLPVTIIKPRPKWKLVDFREIKSYRDVFAALVMREIRTRYKQTVLGGLWAILQPFATMIVFSLFFGKLAKMPSYNVPYPIFSYAALVPWLYFSTALTNASISLTSNQAFISKVYFPRLAIPLAPVIARLLDFVIAFLVLLGMMVYFGIAPTISIMLLPVLTFSMVLCALGVGMWLAALNVQYRDVSYIVPFIVQLWMFVSPIVYPMSMIPKKFQLLYALNPMAGVIEGFRSALLGKPEFPWIPVGMSLLISGVLLLSSLVFFRRMERYFADVV